MEPFGFCELDPVQLAVLYSLVTMATRSVQNQSFHDQVVAIAASYLDSAKYTIYTNPGSEKKTRVGELYPDIIVTNKGSDTAVFIIEVETQDSVTAVEATTQWKEFARLGSTFILMVPAESLGAAKSLCSTYGIKARFAWYLVQAGVLKVTYE